MSLFFTRDENLPPGADDRNVRPSKEPDDYLKPREEEEIEFKQRKEYKPTNDEVRG